MRVTEKFTVAVNGLPVEVVADVAYRLGYDGEVASALVKVVSVGRLLKGGTTTELQQVTQGIIAQIDHGLVYDTVVVQF